MKKNIEVKYFDIKESEISYETLSKIFLKVDDSYLVGNAPWATFQYRPIVDFKIACSENIIFIKTVVKESFIRAKYTQNNDPVYRDSCFEFFISLDNKKSYYNFEFNCIGTSHLAYGKSRENREHADDSVINSIKTYASLGKNSFAERSGDFEWDLIVSIPISAFFKDKLKTIYGESFECNFYKCGDELTKPHYLSWANIETEKPDFHQPKFFGKIEFE